MTEPGTGDLVFMYECVTDRVCFSIADVGGTVYLKGRLRMNSHRVKTDTLPKGIYALCIIDGDELMQARFRKE